jgi:hypothetical protein
MLLQLLLQMLKKQTQLIDIQFVGLFEKWNWGESNLSVIYFIKH